MKNIIIILVIWFTINQGLSQQNLTETNHFERVVFEVGALYPIGKLKAQIAPMPNIGLWYKTRIKGETFAEFGFNTSIMNGLQTYDIQRSDSIFRVKPRGLGGMVGVRFVKNYKLSNRASVEWIPSIGYAFIMHKGDFVSFANKDDSRSINPDTKSGGLSSMHFGQGIRINYDNIGLQAHYQFTPFSIFTNDVSSEFGNQSFVFGLVYRQ